MRLLVSVSDGEEAVAALMGGAAIIDAKDPAQGALGQVSCASLQAIRQAVPGHVPLTAALGDVATLGELEARLAQVMVPTTLLKLGFAAFPDPHGVAALLRAAVEGTARLPGAPGVVAVAYADWESVGALPPEGFPVLLEQTGASGLLVDTAIKGGRRLFDWQSIAALEALSRETRAQGKLFALAGSLGPDDLDRAREVRPDVVGVRGAACEGGRFGRVSTERVRQLERSLSGSSSMASSPITDQGSPAARAWAK